MHEDNPPPSNGRDPVTGTFRPGHRVSVGNQGGRPHVKKMNEYKTALMEAGSPERVAKITDALFTAACGGDTTAAKLLLDHWCGRPVQGVEVTGTEGEPARVEFSTLVAVIMQAVGDDMGARVKIAAALRHHRLSQEGEGDGPTTA
jgi:hypothetical protein